MHSICLMRSLQLVHSLLQRNSIIRAITQDSCTQIISQFFLWTEGVIFVVLQREMDFLDSIRKSI